MTGIDGAYEAAASPDLRLVPPWSPDEVARELSDRLRAERAESR